MAKLALCCGLFGAASSAVINFDDVGAVAHKSWERTEWKNGALLNETLRSLSPGDTLLIPNKTYHIMGGIKVEGLNNVTIQLDGTLEFSKRVKDWPCRGPKEANHLPGGIGPKICRKPLECFELHGDDVTITSSGKGTLDGNGAEWWGIPGLGYLYRGEDRPRLLRLSGDRMKVENILMYQPPYWTFLWDGDGLEVSHSDIDATRISHTDHTVIDETAFNTDGFDLKGRNVWIHDCNVWNQDDSFCVKDHSANVLIERVNSSGVGLTIGSIASDVNNITFRDAHMFHSTKGIYMKFRGSGSITNVLYENIYMEQPKTYPIWIGPAQQSDSAEDPICHANPCSLCWPKWQASELGPLCLTCSEATCAGPERGYYENVTLRNIFINNPKMSAGVVIAHPNAPMKNVVFDNVVVTNPAPEPFGDDHYHCENAGNAVATGNTWPVPACFTDKTSPATALV